MTSDRPVTIRRSTGAQVLPTRSSSSWFWLSLAAAALAFTGSVITLIDTAAYRGLTTAFLPQAIAQDLGNVFVAAPLLAISSALTLLGSFSARAIWLGTTAFTVYNYVIYTFAIPFGPMFLLWVAVLGLSLFASIGGCLSIDLRDVIGHFTSPRALITSAWVLLVVATVFILLWLAEDVPALIDGTAERSAVAMGLPTNPVHILDYAFFLPAGMATAIFLLSRGRPFAHLGTPAFLVFLLLTCVPILITPFVEGALGRSPGWSVIVPVGALAAVVAGSLTWLFWTTRSIGSSPASRTSTPAPPR